MDSKGTFDIPCKLNFRVGPAEEDGDKRPRKGEKKEGKEGEEGEGKTSRIPGVLLKKGRILVALLM